MDTANNSQVARPQTFYPGAHLEIFSHYFPDGDNTDLCRDGSVDTVFSTGDGSYYVFKGSKYWKLTDDSVAAGNKEFTNNVMAPMAAALDYGSQEGLPATFLGLQITRSRDGSIRMDQDKYVKAEAKRIYGGR